jgi:hypothetical protein
VSRGRAWLWSSAVSIGLVAAVVVLADVETVVGQVQSLPWPLVLAGLALLLGEGVFTAVRTRALTRSLPPLRDCLVVTAWWVASLALLPARLGELTGLHLMARRLGQSAGQALNNLFMQRLFDGLILLLLGAIAMSLQSGVAHRGAIVVAVAACALAVAFLIGRLSQIFGALAAALRRQRHRRAARFVLRTALHGRRAARQVLSGRQPARLLAISLCKCLCNVAGLALVIGAVLPALGAAASAAVAALFNLTAAVPLQTIGGIGIGEATFTGAFAWYGVPAGAAASAALLLRAFLIAAPLAFWILVVAGDALVGSRSAGNVRD